MEGDHPAVSVVIPAYCAVDDHEQYLKEALESVANQTFKDFEVVIVDDASPRDITRVIEQIECLKAVRVLRNAKNIGHAESRNAGVRTARSELIAFLDHDDIWHADKLAEQVAVMRANPDAAMVFCEIERFGPRANRLSFDQSRIPERPDFVEMVCYGNLAVTTASAVLVKKQALAKIGFFDSRYSTCDDFDAWLKILMIAPVLHIPRTLAKYRLHDLNVNYSVDRLNDNTLLTRLIWRYWRGATPAERLKLLPVLTRKLVGRVYFSLRRLARS